MEEVAEVMVEVEEVVEMVEEVVQEVEEEEEEEEAQWRRRASSGVISALEVGLDSGKTIGLGCSVVTISSTALGVIAPLTPDNPSSIPGCA